MRLIDADVLKYALGSSDEAIYFDALIDEMPTIEPRINDWTPCAEGLPEKVDKRLWSRDVLATIKQKTGNCFVVVAYYHYGHKHWKTDDMTDNDIIDVLAWQPLPAAWKEPENV